MAQTPKYTPPKPTVSEIFSLEGEWVRIAYNNEGYASMGYRYAQQQIGQEWMLLTVGITVRKPAPNYKLVRANLSITTPDGKRIPLPTQQEYQAANLMALNMRAQSINDSINYYPPDANQPCAIKFFADIELGLPALLRPGRAELAAHLHGPPVLQGPGRRPGRAALPQHQVRATARCRCRSGPSARTTRRCSARSGTTSGRRSTRRRSSRRPLRVLPSTQDGWARPRFGRAHLSQ